MNDIPVFGFGSLLIENLKDENEEKFRLYITQLLAEIYSQLPDWLVFNIGRRFEVNGSFFREFLYPAGSVDARIQMRAEQTGGISRAIVIRGMRSNIPYCILICTGLQTEFRCESLREV